MNKTLLLTALYTVLQLAGCSTQPTSPAANPASKPTLKDYDDAPASGPLFMPFR